MRDRLRKIIPDDDRVITENIDEKYTADAHGTLRGSASAVVFPLTTEEVSRVLRYAYENSIPVTPRGAGTNLTGSTVPLKGGIVLDMSRMNHIIEIDHGTFTAVTEPGVTLKELQEAVEAEGLFYPPDPGERLASIGGNISTNAGGMRAVKYGVTRDYVRGLEVVLADGTVIRLGSKNVKDSSGFSLKNLITGSEGTLAVITKCILRLVPKPEKTVTAVAAFGSLEAGIKSVIDVLGADITPTAVEFVERRVAALGEDYVGVSFPFPDAQAYILLTLDGDAESIGSRLAKLKRTLDKSGADGVRILDDEEAADIWRVRGALVTSIEAVSEQVPVDVVVPLDRTAEFIKYVNELSESTGMTLAGFGHAGDGNVHISVVRGGLDDEEWETLRTRNMDNIYDHAAALGGLTSGEHGIGLTKKAFFRRNTDPAAVLAMKKIKQALDERDILNSGKIFG